MEDMQYRAFHMDDYDALVRLWIESGLEMLAGDDEASIGSKLERDPELFRVAHRGDELAGSIIGAYDGRRGWIYHLAVLPKFRRLGIAQALIRSVEERLVRLGCPLVYLLVDPANEGAIRLYEKLDYGKKRYQLMGKTIGEA